MAEHDNDSWLDMRRRILLLILVAGIAALLLGAGAPLFTGSGDGEPLRQPRTYDPPRPMSDFSLTGPEGEPVHLSDFQGRPVLLFFGYTHCPDVCPTTLAEFRQIKRELGARGERVAFVFVSVDGSRDTPEITGDYVARFDPDFIGLTGEEAGIRAIGEDYSLSFQRSDSDTASGYLVDHTAYTYLLDPAGRLRTMYPFTTPVNTIVEDIEQLMDA